MNVTRHQLLLGGSLAVVVLTVVTILAAVYQDVLTTEFGAVTMSGVLVVATFLYVVLAFDMASTMKNQMQQTQEMFKYQRKDDAVNIIKHQIRPIRIEIIQHKNKFNADGRTSFDSITVNGTLFDRIPELESRFDAPVEPVALADDVDVDVGTVYEYFRAVTDYQRSYESAVRELTIILFENKDAIGVDTDYIQDLAKSALAIEPIGLSEPVWDNVDRDVIQFRSEISDVQSDLYEFRDKIDRFGGELRSGLFEAEQELRDEHYVTPSDLDDIGEQEEVEDERE